MYNIANRDRRSGSEPTPKLYSGGIIRIEDDAQSEFDCIGTIA